ncbi:hypothetical protein RN001_001395 [Aquatica leii]|uniref:Gag protein n=1 Tax=Aquatica leii TaxID=1421715 RepID=A0AAN7Q400_9COLE|nr:hypothetical protein RN001_001395 [Aquatica leii]
MRPFNELSDDWALYQEQLEQFLVINKIKDTENSNNRVAALLSLIGSETYKILRDLCTPQLPKDKTFAELCKMLKSHFSPATCVYRERIEFYEARQEYSEPVNKWYARIHNLATNCNFGVNLKAILTDKFICGMKKGRVRDRLYEENAEATTTLDKLVEIALAKEAAMSAERSEVNWIRDAQKSTRKGTHKNFKSKKEPSNRGK